MREKPASGKHEQNRSRDRLWPGCLRLAFEHVGGRKLQDVIRIGGIRRLSEERERTRGKSVMMGRATAAVMQNQTNAAFAGADLELVVGIERSGQGRQPQSQRRARAGIQQQRAPAGSEPEPRAALVAREHFNSSDEHLGYYLNPSHQIP